MGLRALLAIDEQAPVDIAGMAVEVATEMALDEGLDISITVSRDGRVGFDAGQRPLDLVHVIGRATVLQQFGRSRVPLVLTPTRHPRRGPVPRRSNHADAWWLVHGRSAAVRIVADGLAPSSRVLPLPMLPYLGITSQEWSRRRAGARRALGVTPGSLVVVGIGPLLDRSVEAFREAMRCFNPEKVLSLWIASDTTAELTTAPLDLVRVVGEPVGCQLLAAMDVLVAMGTPYAARCAAVDAAAAGIPVITSPLDAAADYVDLLAGGAFLTSTRPFELTAAVARACRMAGHSRSRAVLPAHPVERADLVWLTRCCYTDALRRPLTATSTLLNGRST